MNSMDIIANREKDGRKIVILENEERCAAYIVAFWHKICSQILETKPSITIALSGGKSPQGTLSALSREQDLPWQKMHIFMVDERFVPPEHEASNYGMIRRVLLDHVRIPQENIHPVDTNLPGPIDAARDYEKKIITHFNLKKPELPRFDIIMLGLGEDGHTASIFPGSHLLGETKKLVHAVSPGGTLRDRVTLTLPVLNNARYILMLVIGRSKTAILEQIIENKDKNLPASRVRPVNGFLLIIADKHAAGK
ncbi:MAG: 6-phosphogluconolactonase [Syntrophorhabdus sp.]